MGRFSDLKDKFKKATDFSDEDYVENDYDEDEYDSEEDSYNDLKSSSNTFGSGESFNYDFSSHSSNSYSNDFSSKITGTAKKASSEGSNIYRMDTGASKSAPTKIDRVLFFVLEDAEDARNIADCMKKNDCVVLTDMSKISPADCNRVLNFLDGVRYICKSQIENINGLLLIVPESILLSGDFYDQVNFGPFSGN